MAEVSVDINQGIDVVDKWKRNVNVNIKMTGR